MFITREELQTAIYEYQVADIIGGDVDDIAVRHAVAAAVSEASSYLNAKYDIRAIFSARGDDRHPLLVEHVKSIAVWYIIKRANTDIIFERAKEYYKAAIDWLRLVAGIGTENETIAPDLPLRRHDRGDGSGVATRLRFGSHPKFDHGLDDATPFKHPLIGLNRE
jgi:phage gp36-like protein